MPKGQPRIGGAIDFYEAPLEEAWDPDEAGDDDEAAGLSNLGALEHKKQVVLYGPPGTGKTHEAKALAVQLLRHQALVRWGPTAFLEHLDLVDDLAARQVHRLQLHASYSYEEFIRGQKLTAAGTAPEDGYLLRLIDEVRASQAKTADGDPLPSGVDPHAQWKLADGDLLRPLPWVLIADELNRSDLSRLLGEAFSILEDRESEVELATLNADGSVRKVSMPADLHVIGTMNLIDQSVEQLDFALRRRFLWIYSGFDGDVIREVVRHKWDSYGLGHHPFSRLEADVELLAERAALLNENVRESKVLGRQYEVGHTYFFDAAGFIRRWGKVRTKGQRPKRYLWKDDGTPLAPVVDLWRHSLRPLMEEYLAGVEPKAREREVERLGNVFLRGPQR